MANLKQNSFGNKRSFSEFDPVVMSERCSRRQQHASLKVMPTSKSLVVPATSIDHPEWLPLTNLDRVMNPTFVNVISFYENVLTSTGPGRQTFTAVIASLKDSLARVLVDFYPLAGRLALKAENGIVDLHCNDAGAIFIEASVNMSLAELGGPQAMPNLSGMDFIHLNAPSGLAGGKIYVPDQINPSIPVLVVQATGFTCGSVAVAVNWHHTVADGLSGCHFMRSWAEVSSGKGLTLQPCHDRQLLKPRTSLDSSTVSNGHCKCKSSSQQAEVKVSYDQEDRIAFAGEHCTAAATMTPAVVKSFLLSKDTVQDLRESIQNEAALSNGKTTDGQQQFTTAESMSSGLWSLMMRAKSINTENIRCEERSKFFMFVDGRKTLGLPEGYFGNVVGSACAESTVGEILSKPLSYGANLIRKAKRSIDGKYFKSLIDWVDEQGITASTRSDHVRSRGYDVAASFWNFFPLYQINFGWGKPVLSITNNSPRMLIDGIFILPGPEGSGNLVALLNLRADHMQNLENDQQFRAAFRPLEMTSRMLPQSSKWNSNINQSHQKMQMVAC